MAVHSRTSKISRRPKTLEDCRRTCGLVSPNLQRRAAPVGLSLSFLPSPRPNAIGLTRSVHAPERSRSRRVSGALPARPVD
jgi:hypothetical protein